VEKEEATMTRTTFHQQLWMQFERKAVKMLAE